MHDDDDDIILGPEVEELDEGYDLENSRYIKKIEKDAEDCMRVFFEDKKYWAGGDIANSKLYTKENIKLVVTVRMADAIEVAYRCLEENEPERWDNQQEDWDLKLVYENVIKECCRRLIPKCFAGGILLVYLALCQGVDYVPTMKEYMLSLQNTYKSST